MKSPKFSPGLDSQTSGCIGATTGTWRGVASLGDAEEEHALSVFRSSENVKERVELAVD